jgi:hypothetical protein
MRTMSETQNQGVYTSIRVFNSVCLPVALASMRILSSWQHRCPLCQTPQSKINATYLQAYSNG